ncbi:hypothetical protein HYQ46_005973 [Verticillium longisporum]|nr:hypothetical protein HYQ46_005973 [Verticillium longisporum]
MVAVAVASSVVVVVVKSVMVLVVEGVVVVKRVVVTVVGVVLVRVVGDGVKVETLVMVADGRFVVVLVTVLVAVTSFLTVWVGLRGGGYTTAQALQICWREYLLR